MKFIILVARYYNRSVIDITVAKVARQDLNGASH
jgi:hypothetical protein